MITGRHAAAAILTASGVLVLALGIFGILRGLTPREAVTGTAGLVAAAVSWLWLRRDKNGGAP